MLELDQPVARGVVVFLLQRLAFDLELDDAAIEFVERLGLGVDLHAQPAGRLVHQVDRLVGQEPVGNVAVRQRRRRHQRVVGDPHPVVQLVFFLDAAQDRDRVLDRGLRHEYRLEAPGQRRVLLDVLAILVERGGAHAMQLAARQRRLEQVGGIHRPFGRARADQRVQLVDEQDQLAGRGGDLVEHGLQAFLELAAELGAGHQRTQVERQQPLVLEQFRHVAVDDALRQPLDDGGLADAGLADQHRVVLGAPGENLNRSADFLVAADHRIELAVARRLGEVARVFLQRLETVLGRGGVGLAALAHVLDGAVERLRIDPRVDQRLRGGGAGGHRQRQQNPLGGDEGVAGLLGDLLDLVEQPRGGRVHVDLPGAGTLDLGHLGQRGADRGRGTRRVAPGGADQVGGKAFLVVEQHLEDMFRREALMPFAQGKHLCSLDETLAAFRVFLEIHDRALSLSDRTQRPFFGSNRCGPKKIWIGLPPVQSSGRKLN